MDDYDVMYKFNNKSKSTGKTVAIVFLTILLLAALTYIFYNEYVNVLSNKKEEKKIVRKDMYYKEVKEILDQIELYNYVFKSVYPVSNVNDVDNQLKLQFGINALKKTENTNNYFNEDDLDDIYNNYFIDSFDVIYENIDCPNKDGVLYKLNNDTKTYSLEEKHEHGMNSMDVDTYYVSDKIKGNKYIIYTHILYSNYCSDMCNDKEFSGYYKSYKDAIEGKNPVTYKRSEYNDIESSLPTTVFTFIKNKSHYKLESVKIN